MTGHRPRPGRGVRGTSWAILTAVALGLGGCGGGGDSDADRDKPRVRVTCPTVRQVIDYVYFTGRTEAVEAVQVQARVMGYLDSIDFSAGAEVKKGQRLFQIDPRPYKAALDEANSQVELAESRLALAIANYKRALGLAETPGAISQQDVDKYAAAKDEALAAVNAAKAHCESARLNVEYTTITSPVDGLTGRNLLTVGNLVKQDQTLLTTVVSQDPVYAYFDADETTLLRVQRLVRSGEITSSRVGGKVPVEMGLSDEENGYPHEGWIDYVSNQINPSTGTIQIRGVFPNPPKGPSHARLFAPGMFVRIRLPIGKPYDAVLVPQAAIGTEQSRKFVLIVDENDVVQSRWVKLGPEQPGGLVAVLPEGQEPSAEGKPVAAPLSPQDRVIVGGLQRIRPGMSVVVRPVRSEETTAPPAV